MEIELITITPGIINIGAKSKTVYVVEHGCGLFF
jgi:hypothetical protein